MTLTPAEIEAIANEVANQLKPLLGIQQQAELNKAEVASLLKVSQPTIERWTRAKVIPSYLVGRCRRYNREAVLKAAQEVREDDSDVITEGVEVEASALGESSTRELQTRRGA